MSEASIAPMPAGMSPAVLPDRRRSNDPPSREQQDNGQTGGDGHGQSHGAETPAAAAPTESEESPVDAATLFAATLLGNAFGTKIAPPARPADEWEAPPSETRITDRTV